MQPPTAAWIDVNRIITAYGGFLNRKPQKQHQPPPMPLTPAQKWAKVLTPYELRWEAGRNLRTKTFAEMQREISREQNSLTGLWKKDKAASDSMAEACDMVALPWYLRQALNVLTSLEVEDTATHFRTNIKAGGVMDVKERYPWTGEIVEHSRRDKRKGIHKGKVVQTADGPCIQVEWDNPYGGQCSDTFILSEDGNTMTQVSDMAIRDSGRRCVYKTVYRRQK